MDTAQPLSVHYLFDARQAMDVTGAPLDFFFSNLHRGAAVDRLFADEDNITSWSDLPTGRWVHLTASSNRTLSGQVRVSQSGPLEPLAPFACELGTTFQFRVR